MPQSTRRTVISQGSSLPTVVSRLLESDPLLFDFLQRGLGNVTAVAAEIQGQIRAETGAKHSLPAIGMAVRRVMQRSAGRMPLDWRFPANVPISARSQIYEVAIEQSRRAKRSLEKIRERFAVGRGAFFSIVEGHYEVVFYVDQGRGVELRKLLRGERITSEIENLACVTVNWPRITKDVPGIYFRITRELALRGISIQAMHTIGAEMAIFVREDALVATHQAIAELLSS